MREYNGTPILENEGEPITTIKLDHIPEFDIGDYDLTNEKDLFKYFKNIERICRSSRSYKKLVEYLRSCVDMNKCSFFKNVNNIDTYSIKIHIHHTPLTLYDIVTTVYSKRVANHESVTENAVAKEVMFNHYTTCVGLIPLSLCHVHLYVLLAFVLKSILSDIHKLLQLSFGFHGHEFSFCLSLTFIPCVSLKL